MMSRTRRRPATYLLTVKQSEDESLKAYLAHFNKEDMMVEDQDEEKIMLIALLAGKLKHIVAQNSLPPRRQ